MIYADNAATTELDINAFEAMRPFLLSNYGNASQPYSFASMSKTALNDARVKIAKCIGANSEEIFFTSCGTESDNWAIKLGAGYDGDIMTSVIEHHAILNSCKALERQGRTVIYVPVSHEGEINLNYLEKHVTDNTRLISVMYANNEIGTIQPIKKLTEIAHKYGCLFHTDAVQAVGHVAINVHELGIDLLSASAHKFNGPKGIGFLYIREGTKLNSYMDGGGQEKGYRAGTENVASVVAMAVALENNCQSIVKNSQHIIKLEKKLLSKLDMAGVEYLRNGSSNRIPGNISLSFPDAEGEMLLHRLDLRGICISTGSACDSINTQVSHVINSIGVPQKYAEGTIRISLGKNNTEDDVIAIAEELIKILRK